MGVLELRRRTRNWPRIVGISNAFWLLVGGVSTDRYGARSVMLAVTVAALVTAYPVMRVGSGVSAPSPCCSSVYFGFTTAR
jgi:hypothetical protein